VIYRRLLRPTLFNVAGRDAETIHERVLGMLARISVSPAMTQALARLAAITWPGDLGREREVFGVRFPQPIGLAAGFDKNARAVHALAALGFGFVEIGTITQQAQPGNPRPRLFRIPSDDALINRMGFNNDGANAIAKRLARTREFPVPVGISLGKSKVTPLEDAIADYLASLDRLYPWANYFAVNVSSPNTPGLRVLQERERLDALLEVLQARLRERAQLADEQVKPLLVKVAPDLDDTALDDVIGVCLARGASGLIAVNTTVSRYGLSAAVPDALLNEVGGLSGRPLHARAVEVVSLLARRTEGRLPIIGCGGIFTVDDAQRLLDAGASLLQIYTSFIYEGPGIARTLARGLTKREQHTPIALPKPS
jgi:dihydroorotate dehydrogenase